MQKHEKENEPTSFEERLGIRIADIVAQRVIEACVGKYGDMSFEAKMIVSGNQLFGCRLAQFRRFCQLMRENPTERPYRAAKRALDEVRGHGGYKSAAALQRYAGNHREYWEKSL